MFYRIAKYILKVLLFFVFRIKVEGKENVPAEGGVLLAVNHRSNWDPVIAAVGCPRKLRFMAKSELFKNKLFGALITALGAFPIQRGKGDIGAIKGALTILKNNETMLIFPEGGRVHDERSAEAKPGVVMLAIRAKAPVVPAYISGKYHWFSRMTIHFGEPVYYDMYYDEKPVVEQLQSLSNELLKTMRSFKVQVK
jgi:1-acyl-sn-glycerol-3-phosphate acyltransferase